MAGDEDYEVVVSAGSLRPEVHGGVAMQHRWTADGVVIEGAFTGAHLYHLAAAGCLLNDTYREAERLRIGINGVRVRAGGGFDSASWSSTGIVYEIEVDSDATNAEIDHLLLVVDEVAEIPKALRSGTTVSPRRAQ